MLICCALMITDQIPSPYLCRPKALSASLLLACPVGVLHAFWVPTTKTSQCKVLIDPLAFKAINTWNVILCNRIQIFFLIKVSRQVSTFYCHLCLWEIRTKVLIKTQLFWNIPEELRLRKTLLVWLWSSLCLLSDQWIDFASSCTMQQQPLQSVALSP